jgi:hypothetical protein
MTKEMAGSTRNLLIKKNILLPNVVINFGFILVIQPQSFYVREYLEIIILTLVIVLE